MSENTYHLPAYSFTRGHRIVKINASVNFQIISFPLVYTFLQILFILCSIFEYINIKRFCLSVFEEFKTKLVYKMKNKGNSTFVPNYEL